MTPELGELLRKHICHCDIMYGFNCGHGAIINQIDAALKAEVTAKAASLFAVIKHGDQGHQDWLEGAIQAHFEEQE